MQGIRPGKLPSAVMRLSLSFAGASLSLLIAGCLSNPPGVIYPCPAVTVVNPPDGATDVPLNNDITIKLNEPLTDVPPDIFVLILGNDTVPGSTTYEPVDTSLVFNPSDGLLPDTTYTAILTSGGGSPFGTPLDTVLIWTFTTTDTTPQPGGVDITPGDGAVDVPLDVDIEVSFPDPVNPVFLDSTAIVLTLGDDTIPGTLTYSPEDTTLVFDPADSLIPDTTYTVTVTIPTDSVSVMGPVDTTFSWTFTTVDTVPEGPKMEYPGNNAVNVPNAKLWWYKVAAAVTYRIQLSQNPAFSPVTLDAGGITATGTMVNYQSVGLAPHTLYYWRVQGINSSGTAGPWSQVRSFTTQP